MKNYKIFLSLILASSLLFGCSAKQKEDKISGILTLSINPEFALQYDQDGIVDNLIALNEDAANLNIESKDYLEQSCQDVINLILNKAHAAGYLLNSKNNIILQIKPNSLIPNEDFVNNLKTEIDNFVKELTLKLETITITEKDYENNNDISEEKALEIALAKAKVNKTDITLIKHEKENDDDLSLYQIKFKTATAIYDFEINATTGKIIISKTELINTNALDPNKAFYIAINDANISTEEIVSSDIDFEDDHYEITFSTLKSKYEYKISANSGKILTYKKEEIISMNNDFTLNKALELALNHVNLNKDDIKLLKYELDFDNDKLIYEIEFSSNNSKYEFEIDANDRKIMKYEKEEDKTSDHTSISLDQAIKIALNHLGLSNSNNIYFYEKKLEEDDGKYYFEIEFIYNYLEYEFKIDAQDGKIIKFEKENKDD